MYSILDKFFSRGVVVIYRYIFSVAMQAPSSILCRFWLTSTRFACDSCCAGGVVTDANFCHTTGCPVDFSLYLGDSFKG